MCGHEGEAVIAKRANGQGCPLCAQGNRTSFPEKALSYYLWKNGFTFIENYRADWLGAFELDIYIPELQTAVEYDGYAWHQDVDKDIRKSTLCRQNGVALIRTRENRCPEINDDSLCFFIPNRNDDGLNQAIRFVLSTLQKHSSLFNEPEDINVARDRMKIYALMKLRKKEHSFALVRPDLLDEWDYEKNGVMQPEDVAPFSDKKIWWKCRNHGHEWEAVIKSRTKGSGCPVCSGNRVLAGFNDLATSSPQLAAEWHPTKNAPLSASEITPQSGLKVWWQCHACGFEWEAAVYSRNGAKHACPECAKMRVHTKLRLPKPRRSLLEREPVLAAQWLPHKNGELTPEDVTLKTHQKV